MRARYGSRQAVQLPGKYWITHGITREVMVSDISQKGCRMQERFSSLKVGSIINLQIGASEPIRGHVRWLERGGLIGVEFAQAIDPTALTP